MSLFVQLDPPLWDKVNHKAVKFLRTIERKHLNAALAEFDGNRAKALADGLRLLAQTDLRPAIRDIRQPVHIIHGAADALMPVTAARWLAEQCPHSQLTVFEDCGHAPFLSRPEDCAALITGALRD